MLELEWRIVIQYAYFQDAGYQGLYNMGLSSVKARKGLKQKDDLLDHAGELELSANDFRTKLTEHRLNRNNVKNESDAIETHRSVGAEVRGVILKENGVRPEDLPIESSITSRVRRERRELKKRIAPPQITQGD